MKPARGDRARSASGGTPSRYKPLIDDERESRRARAPKRRIRKAPPPIEPQILFMDEHILVVNKPSGILSVRGRGDEPALPEWLARDAAVAALGKPRTVHRLDREASGVIVFARTLAAQQSLVEQFRTRQVEKRYLALVSGYVSADGEVDLPLSPAARGNAMRVDRRHGKRSRTHYSIVQRLTGNTLVECRPVTGRMHQIRVHMAAIGHPLTVDPLYGGGEAVLLSNYKPKYKAGKDEERPLLARVSLHSAGLTFRHPATGERVSFEAPLPKDMRATVTQLGKGQ